MEIGHAEAARCVGCAPLEQARNSARPSRQRTREPQHFRDPYARPWGGADQRMTRVEIAVETSFNMPATSSCSGNRPTTVTTPMLAKAKP